MDFAQLPRPFARWWWRMRGTKGVRSKQPTRVPSWSGVEFREVFRGRRGGLRADDKVMEVPWTGDSWFEIVSGFFLSVGFLVATILGAWLGFATIFFSEMIYRQSSFYVIVFDIFFNFAIGSAFIFISILCVSYLSVSCLCFRSRWRRRGGRGQLHRIVFDRENGRVLLPPVGQGEYESVAWEDLVVRDFGVPKPHGGAHRQLKAIRPNDLRVVTIDGDWPDREEFWALCCWYMDRSKPLPPDRVFDPYRERDEERRLREFGPEVVRQFPASLTGPGTRLVTQGRMAGAR